MKADIVLSESHFKNEELLCHNYGIKIGSKITVEYRVNIKVEFEGKTYSVSATRKIRLSEDANG